MKEKEAGMQAAESISISYGSNPCLKQKAKNDDGWIESRWRQIFVYKQRSSVAPLFAETPTWNDNGWVLTKKRKIDAGSKRKFSGFSESFLFTVWAQSSSLTYFELGVIERKKRSITGILQLGMWFVTAPHINT